MDRRPDDMSLLKQARAWHAILQQTPSEAERTAAVAWMRRSRRHAAALIAVATEEHLIRTVGASRRSEIRRLLVRIAHEGGFHRTANRRRPRWRTNVRALPIAIVTLALLTATVYLSDTQQAQLTEFTQVGETRRLSLPDASVIELNTHSTISLHFTSTQREVTLVNGEAFFRVAHDARRPFSVRIGPLSVQDLGTAFSIRIDPQRTVINVLDGSIRLHAAIPLRLRTPSNSDPHSVALQGAVDAERGSSLIIIPLSSGATPSLSVEKAVSSPDEQMEHIAWTRGEFIVKEPRPLSEVIDELNRYTRRPLVLADPTLGAILVLGVFRTSRSDYARVIAELIRDDNIPVDLDESDLAVIRIYRRPPMPTRAPEH